MNQIKVLVVDDDEILCNDIANELNKSSFNVDISHNLNSAIDSILKERHDVYLIDLHLQNIEDSFKIISKIKMQYPNSIIVAMSVNGDTQRAINAMKNGAVDVLLKPFAAIEIESKINRIAESISLEKTSLWFKDSIIAEHEIIGESPEIKQLKMKIAIIAKSNSKVLITGPSGSGKELVAWAIRNTSKRNDMPFEIVNCSAIPEPLIESELFGTAKGAFTGAIDRRGKFYHADGGTLFLDEIGDMPILIQTKILRVIEYGEFTQLGSDKSIKVDVRIIAATNKDIKQLVKQKTFREDLYFRLNVARLETPSLKQHATDIPVLIGHFLKLLRVDYSIEQLFSKKALAYLMSLEWPGNVRQLYNLIERLLLFWNGEIIDSDAIRMNMSDSFE